MAEKNAGVGPHSDVVGLDRSSDHTVLDPLAHEDADTCVASLGDAESTTESGVVDGKGQRGGVKVAARGGVKAAARGGVKATVRGGVRAALRGWVQVPHRKSSELQPLLQVRLHDRVRMHVHGLSRVEAIRGCAHAPAAPRAGS